MRSLALACLPLLLTACEGPERCGRIAIRDPGRVIYSTPILNSYRLLVTSSAWEIPVTEMCPSDAFPLPRGEPPRQVVCDAKGFSFTDAGYISGPFDVTFRAGQEDMVGTGSARFPADDPDDCDGRDANGRTIPVRLEY